MVPLKVLLLIHYATDRLLSILLLRIFFNKRSVCQYYTGLQLPARQKEGKQKTLCCVLYKRCELRMGDSFCTIYPAVTVVIVPNRHVKRGETAGWITPVLRVEHQHAVQSHTGGAFF